MDNFEPVDIDFLINSDEVKADAKKVKDDIHGIGDAAEDAAAKVSGIGGKGAAGPLDQAGQAAERAGKKAAASRPQWNGLGNSINQMSREIPAFTYSAQTGFLALSNNIPILADEIAKLKAENLALTASGQKGVPVWKQVLKGLVSWQTALSVGVALLTIYGKDIIDWIGTLIKGKEAIDQLKKSKELLNKAFEGSEFTNAVKEISLLKINLDLAKEGLLEKKTVVEQYNKSIGKTAKDAKTLADVEQGLIDNADLYIEMTLKKAAANLALEDAAKKAYEAAQMEQKEAAEFADLYEKDQAGLKRRVGTDEYGVPVYDNEAYKKAVNEAGEKRKKVQIDQKKEEQKVFEDIAADLQRDYAEAYKKLSPGGEEEEPSTKILNDRKNLLEKIADLDREYARKQLDRDGEELQALRDKFLKVRQLIEEFNRDPKNAAKKIDITGLGVIQEKAEQDLVYKQDTRALQEELAKQKELYREIEEFKTNFGVEKTQERYGEQLKKYDSYAAAIRQKVVNNQSAFDAVENGTATAAESERVKFLKKETDKENKLAAEKYNVLLQEYRAFEEERKLLTERFQEEYNKLVLEQNFEEADKRKEIYFEELDALTDANLKKKESYKSLFKDVGRLTIEAGKRIIADAKKLMQTEEMSAETRARILKLITDTEAQIADLKEDNILKVASALGELGEKLNEIGAGIGNASLRNIGSFLSSLAGGVDDLMKALKFDESTDDLDKFSAGIGAAVQLIGMLGTAAAQRRAAEEEYYRTIIAFQNDINLGLNERIRLESILGENAFITDYEGRITDGLAAVNDANRQYQEAIGDLADARMRVDQENAVNWGAVGEGAVSGATLGATIGSAFTPVGTLIGGAIGAIGGAIAGLFGGRERRDVYGSLLGNTEGLVELVDGVRQINAEMAESLLQSDLLDEASRQIVQNVLDWHNALEEARAQIRQVITDLSGSLSDDLRTALVDSFVAGEDAAIRMGDTVEKVLENIVSNLVFNRIFSTAFDELEAAMASSYDIGGDGTWVDDFSRFFNEASGLADDFNDAMRDAQNEAERYGFDIFNPEDDSDGPNGLQGAIRREMTEETASELTGLFRGQFDVTKRHFELHERHFALEQQHLDSTRRIMQHSAFIEQNTAETVVQLQLAVGELRAIKSNTGGQTARDLGI